MKSEYDNKAFFEEYKKMPRSQYGLSAAGGNDGPPGNEG